MTYNIQQKTQHVSRHLGNIYTTYDIELILNFFFHISDRHCNLFVVFNVVTYVETLDSLVVVDSVINHFYICKENVTVRIIYFHQYFHILFFQKYT